MQQDKSTWFLNCDHRDPGEAPQLLTEGMAVTPGGQNPASPSEGCSLLPAPLPRLISICNSCKPPL